jgi:hypothetical protein
MALTKARIVEALLAENIFTRTQSAQIIDTLFELIKQSLQNGEDVLISGFGKLTGMMTDRFSSRVEEISKVKGAVRPGPLAKIRNCVAVFSLKEVSHVTQ